MWFLVLCVFFFPFFFLFFRVFPSLIGLFRFLSCSQGEQDRGDLAHFFFVLFSTFPLIFRLLSESCLLRSLCLSLSALLRCLRHVRRTFLQRSTERSFWALPFTTPQLRARNRIPRRASHVRRMLFRFFPPFFFCLCSCMFSCSDWSHQHCGC
jgi:hypothetical protein